VDRRRFPRVEVQARGCLYTKACKDGTRVTITGLSRSGLQFELTDPCPLEIGERATIEFTLAEHEGMTQSRRISIRSVEGRSVGAEFLATDPTSAYERMCDAALAFFTQRRSDG